MNRLGAPRPEPVHQEPKIHSAKTTVQHRDQPAIFGDCNNLQSDPNDAEYVIHYLSVIDAMSIRH
jgi:hypothetical protein